MRDERSRGTPVGRRVVLGMLGLGAVGVVFGAKASDALARALTPLTSGSSGGSGILPGAGGFRFYTVTGEEPRRDADDYRLTVRGLVRSPHTYTLDSLRTLPHVSFKRDFQCVTGWRVPDVPWQGVRLAEILRRAGVTSSAKAVTFTSFDGAYTESLTLDQAMRPDVLIATAMYGKPITTAHGGPVRLYAAPMYGYKSIKWLGGIEVRDRVVPGYWEDRGYDVDAWVGRSNGRSDKPTG
ncbi:MAG: molybdopterin-dependent oxidoreductase [Streptosporangiales bacterium]|nr:molybdopterin-dependent oxidoreductase [Streptosporangiales bacterium]MBO0892545.1 molybdopterin-dependent oxidoreductase [Acidothermales bacterium]